MGGLARGHRFVFALQLGVERAGCPCAARRRENRLERDARVRAALSSYIYRRTKRSPMILPILLEV